MGRKERKSIGRMVQDENNWTLTKCVENSVIEKFKEKEQDEREKTIFTAK